MEHQTTMHHNFILNTILVAITTSTGFISSHFTDQLTAIDMILAPVVKLCSVISFLIFVILNYDAIKLTIKKWCNK